MNINQIFSHEDSSPKNVGDTDQPPENDIEASEQECKLGNTTETYFKGRSGSIGAESKQIDREQLPVSIADLNSHFDTHFAKAEMIMGMQRSGGIASQQLHGGMLLSLEKSAGGLW